MRRYKQSDLGQINDWRAVRMLPALVRAQLPRIGVIEPGVAAVFLHQVEGGLGLVETLITNPLASSDLRAQAFEDGWKMLQAEARAAGMKRLLAITENYAATKRAVELAGMAVQPGVLVLRKDLR